MIWSSRPHPSDKSPSYKTYLHFVGLSSQEKWRTMYMLYYGALVQCCWHISSSGTINLHARYNVLVYLTFRTADLIPYMTSVSLYLMLSFPYERVKTLFLWYERAYSIKKLATIIRISITVCVRAKIYAVFFWIHYYVILRLFSPWYVPQLSNSLRCLLTSTTTPPPQSAAQGKSMDPCMSMSLSNEHTLYIPRPILFRCTNRIIRPFVLLLCLHDSF